MKSKFDIKSLLLGLCLGAAIVFSVAAASTSEPTAWEYRTLEASAFPMEIDKKLNEAAADGWALVGTSMRASEGTTTRVLMICKRPRQ